VGGVYARLAVALVVAAACLTLPASAQQQSFGVTPGMVTIPDAQPGQTYLREVTLQNELDTRSTITVDTQGDAGPWLATQPATGFAVEAHTAQRVQVTITVPGGAALGQNVGRLRFTTEPKGTLSGSGEQLRYSVIATFNITVGGQRHDEVAWSDPRVHDAEQGQIVHALLHATNVGNVATKADATGAVLPFASDAPVLSHASGSVALRPGEEGDVELDFPAGLVPAQYRAILASSPPAFNATLDFKVVPVGGAAPDGHLRGINHEAFGIAGQPVRLDAWFENTGNAPIVAAKFKAEVHRGDANGPLLAAIESDALAVAPGQQVNLTLYWTPPEAGTYWVTGPVLYDGYLTLNGNSILNVKDAPGALGSFPWIWLVLLVLVVLAIVVWLVVRRRQRKGPDAGR